MKNINIYYLKKNIYNGVVLRPKALIKLIKILLLYIQVFIIYLRYIVYDVSM